MKLRDSDSGIQISDPKSQSRTADPSCQRARIPGETAAIAVALLVLASLVCGCGRPAGVIFEPLATPLVWPTPPEQSRIRYVGQLVTSADLKPAVSFFQGFTQVLFGKEETQSMLSPYALCTDNADRLFVADSNAQLVHVFNLKTRQYSQWRPANAGKRFSQPVGIAYDAFAKRLAVADSVGGCVSMFDDAGKYIGDIGRGAMARPCGLAFDRAGRLFVADTAAHQVLVVGTDGQIATRIGERGSRLGQFNFPTNVALDSKGQLYVSDSLNFRVQQFSHDLEPIRQIGQEGDMPGYFRQPKGVAVDAEDHIYVIDANFEVVQIFNDEGEVLMDFGAEGRGYGEFWLPAGIFIDARNRVWVADTYNRRVQVFDYLPEKKP
jgi:sugar lactone lactonase YvrE